VTHVWGDIFSLPAFLDAHKKLPKVAGCTAERAVVPLMFWSDSTHLTSFGTAKLWPIYMFFRSQNKLLRMKPTAHVCHHVAYIPSVSSCARSPGMYKESPIGGAQLPDALQDFVRAYSDGTAAQAPLLTHSCRELMQAIWMHLLDNEFVQAYEHGILVVCADHVTRHIFPHIMTYSADYPEK
jgi:Plavaka transposase